jgi:hypothetical protein
MLVAAQAMSYPYSYAIYGLGVQFNLRIPALDGVPPPNKVDVLITLGTMPHELAATSTDDIPYCPDAERDESLGRKIWLVLGGRYFRFQYQDGTTIAIASDGSAVWVTWVEHTTVDDAAVYLLGPILGFVLRLRGVTCLHASAIAIRGKAVALVGPSGAGKSSTAAAFAQMGCPVLSDDVVALDDDGTLFNVHPAYPRVRLWPESVKSLFGAADALPLITPNWNKRFLDLNGSNRFQHKPLPLAAVYVFSDREAISRCSITEIDRRSAVMELISNTYGNHLLDTRLRAQEFELLCRLVEVIPVRRITPSTAIEQISDMCQAIAEDCLQLCP